MPLLSVIFLSLDGGASLKKVLRHLSTHQWAGHIEIVVAISEEAALALDPPQGLAGFHVVRSSVLDDMGRARATAIRAASAQFVALGEDHSFPVEGWAQALLAPLEAGAPAVGPQILVANPATSVSWCDAILCYGDYLRPSQQNDAKRVPWHNSAYRREVLLAFGDKLDFLLGADSLLQAALAGQGHRFALTPHAATNHCNHSLLRPHWILGQSPVWSHSGHSRGVAGRAPAVLRGSLAGDYGLTRLARRADLFRAARPPDPVPHFAPALAGRFDRGRRRGGLGLPIRAGPSHAKKAQLL